MSEFIAEAQVLVRPDTTGFRAALEAQLLAATRGVTVPVTVTPVAAQGVTSAVAATQALSATTATAARNTQLLAGAQTTLATTTKQSTAALLGAGTAAARLDAGLLALRTAVGSTAVIGLGALALAAIAAGKAFTASLNNFIEFQRELSVFRVTAGATADEMQRVSEAATALGADVKLPGVSAGDAAVAMTELAKAGLTVQESIDGAEGVLQLATAAQISNAEAAQIAANALNSFGLAGDQATRVADDLANAANAAQGSISDFGFAFAQSSAVARQVGLSLEDTTAILSLFAKNGLQGSDAGTSLRVALIRLVAPTKAAAAEIDKLGLKIRDANGAVRADVFAQFGKATEDLAPAARDAAAALIFGQDAIRAVSIGAREGEEGLRAMQFQIDQTGTAAELAAARTEGLGGSLSNLKSGAETLSIDFGKLISLGLKPYVDAVALAITLTNKFATALNALGSAALNVETPIGKIGDRLFDVLSVGVPIIGEVRLIRAGIDRLGIGGDEAAEKIADLNKELQNLQKARIGAELGGDPLLADQLTQRIEKLKQTIHDLELESQGVDIGGTVGEQIRQLKVAIDSLQGTTGSEQAIARLEAQIRNLQSGLQATGAPIRDFSADVGHLGEDARNAAGGVDSLTAALTRLKQESTTLSDQLQKAQAAGASPQSQIALLAEQNQTQREIIANAERNGRQAGDITAIRKARAAIIANNAQIKSLQGQIVSDQKAAASDAEAQAKDAQSARDEQFKALAETFGGRQADIANAIERAGINDNIAKQIKLNQALIASLKKERAVLLARLKALKVSAELRKQILQGINKALEEARQDAIRLQKEQQEKINDAINTRLDLRIQLAEARDNVAAQIKARRAKLAQITSELVRLKNAGKKNTNAWLALKVQQAEEIAAIKELEGKTKEKQEAGKSLFFQFLQTQQGFAANLLGNIIPGFATKGLVGSSGDTGDAGEGLRQVAGGFEQPRGAAATSAALASSRDRGVRPVQVDTTNQILRKILAALNNLNGRAQSPEARYQKNVSGGAMDTL